jgi:fructokinase
MGLVGGIEAGGTKFVCMIASGPDDVRAEASFPTTTPAETIARAMSFFREHSSESSLSAIGVASFGPVDLNPESPTFGHITTTPKPGWARTDIVGPLRRAFRLPIAFETDVNAAAYGERRWGAARGLDSMIYITVGTGIGGGIVSEGRLVHGLVHPEVGHMLIPHDRDLDPFPGACPFHRDCFEGLASGTALRERWGRPAETLPEDHLAWDLEAHYLALALANLVLINSPRRIIIGGGVMQRQRLFPVVRARVRELLNGYVQASEIVESIDPYIVPPALGDRSGVLGAVALALDSADAVRNHGTE